MILLWAVRDGVYFSLHLSLSIQSHVANELKSSAYATRGSRIRRTKESEKHIVKITLMKDLSTTPKLTSLIRDKWIPTRTHCIRSDRKLENHINALPAVIPLAFSAETALWCGIFSKAVLKLKSKLIKSYGWLDNWQFANWPICTNLQDKLSCFSLQNI